MILGVKTNLCHFFFIKYVFHNFEPFLANHLKVSKSAYMSLKLCLHTI